MNIKPILFSTPMVQAILAGRKTQTRRVVAFIKGFSPTWSGYVADGVTIYGSNNTPAAKAKYQIGDILWVRETWTAMRDLETGHVDYFYAANKLDHDTVCTTYQVDDDGFETGRRFPFKPSIHMPKSIARIFLRVIGVRAERLLDITIADCENEGCKAGDKYAGPQSTPALTARQSFMWLWQKLNDERGYSWASNPWVWVYTFERCEKPEG
jgi:hypothetical protein